MAAEYETETAPELTRATSAASFEFEVGAENPSMGAFLLPGGVLVAFVPVKISEIRILVLAPAALVVDSGLTVPDGPNGSAATCIMGLGSGAMLEVAFLVLDAATFASGAVFLWDVDHESSAGRVIPFNDDDFHDLPFHDYALASALDMGFLADFDGDEPGADGYLSATSLDLHWRSDD